MGEGLAIALGFILGIVASLPTAFLFERALKGVRKVSVGAGFVGILASFLMLTCAILAVWAVSRDDVLAFGSAAAGSFLLLWVVEAWRAWHDAQRPFGQEKGKSGGSA